MNYIQEILRLGRIFLSQKDYILLCKYLKERKLKDICDLIKICMHEKHREVLSEKDRLENLKDNLVGLTRLESVISEYYSFNLEDEEDEYEFTNEEEINGEDL